MIKLYTVLLLCTQIQHLTAAGESKEADRLEEAFHQELSYSEKFPQLASDFRLTGQNFDEFMKQAIVFTNSPNDETPIDSDGRTAEAVGVGLTNAIMQAEQVVLDCYQQPMKDFLKSAIDNYLNIDFVELSQLDIRRAWIKRNRETYPGDEVIEQVKHVVDNYPSEFSIAVIEPLLKLRYVSHYDCYTHMQSAVYKNLSQTVSGLLKVGADANSKHVLFTVMRNNQDQIAEMLLDAGADFNVVDECGFILLAHSTAKRNTLDK